MCWNRPIVKGEIVTAADLDLGGELPDQSRELPGMPSAFAALGKPVAQPPVAYRRRRPGRPQDAPSERSAGGSGGGARRSEKPRQREKPKPDRRSGG